jgi:hypothetical protein
MIPTSTPLFLQLSLISLRAAFSDNFEFLASTEKEIRFDVLKVSPSVTR